MKSTYCSWCYRQYTPKGAQVFPICKHCAEADDLASKDRQYDEMFGDPYIPCGVANYDPFSLTGAMVEAQPNHYPAKRLEVA